MTAKRKRTRPQPSAGNQRLQLHRQVARESLQRLLASPLSSGITVLVIAIALFLPALLYLLNSNLNAGLVGAADNTRLTIYLQSNISNTNEQAVSEYLLSKFGSESIEYISEEQAMESFSRSAELGDLLTSLPDNPLPAAFVVSPQLDDDTEIENLILELETMEGVELVQLDRLWLQRLQALSDLLTLLSRALALVVLVGLLAIVGNTIKLLIEHRRQEIQVIKLIGGSNSYIARPFLYTGLMLGLTGGLCACLLIGLMGLNLATAVAELSDLFGGNWRLNGLDALQYLTLVLTGGGIGWLAALIASYRNIATIEP